MTGGRTLFANTEYAVYHLLLRHDELSSRRIIEIMVDAGCGYFAPASIQLGAKMRIWGYNLHRRRGGNLWSMSDQVKEPQRSKTMPLRFLEFVDEKWPLNK